MPIALALLGCGNMGSAIVLGLAKKSPDFIFHLYDPLPEKSKKLASQAGGVAVEGMDQLKNCEYFLLACKPQQFGKLARELKGVLGKNSKVISILAGTSSKTIQEGLRCRKLARVMPNTPCLINQGACAIYFVDMDEKEKGVVRNIFSAVAEVFLVDSDDAIDKATAVIGSGPAYYFEFTRVIADQLAKLGIDSKMAESMAKQVAQGASALMLQSGESPETLRKQVTSKKGTTQAALDVFKSRDLEGIIQAVIVAAYRRAKELSKKKTPRRKTPRRIEI